MVWLILAKAESDAAPVMSDKRMTATTFAHYFESARQAWFKEEEKETIRKSESSDKDMNKTPVNDTQAQAMTSLFESVWSQVAAINPLLDLLSPTPSLHLLKHVLSRWFVKVKRLVV